MKTKKILTGIFIGAILILSISAKAQEGLFISEVTDPADDYTGRFIEIFNAGAETVDFNVVTFYLSRQSNGGAGWGEVQLAGTVAAGEAFVIGGSAFESLYGFAADQVSGIITGNGDDAYFLFRDGDHISGSLHDIFGAIDTDGTGEAWEYEDSRAVRMVGITAPGTVWNSTEWEITPADIEDTDPGTHHGSPVGDTILPGSYSLMVQDDTVEMGQPVEVLIVVSELTTADNIISCQFDIGFDTSALEYTGIELTGTIAEGGETVVNPNIPGKLSVSYMNLTPLTGAGALLKLQFNSLAVDTCEISISNAWLNNMPIQDLANGTLIIRKVTTPTAVISYNDSVNRYTDTLLITAAFSEMMHEANPVYLQLSGAVTLENAEMTRQSPVVYTYSYRVPKAGGTVSVKLSNGTDMWGNVVDSVPTGGNTFYILPFTPGDVDDDGIILAYDAAIALQYSVGLDPVPAIDPIPWEPWRYSTANVDGTGTVTAYDAGLILQFSAGIISSFPGDGNKSFSGADVSLDIVDGEIIFYAYGDLVGFNLSTTDENGLLGIPVVPDTSHMSAFNNSGISYNIGLCTAYPPDNGVAFMKIPFNKSGTVTFCMIVNTEEKSITVDLVTGMVEVRQEDITFYPNPASNNIFINTGDNINLDGCQLKIINQMGITSYTARLEESKNVIHLSDWSGKGLNYLQVIDSFGNVLLTRKVIFQ